ncbi:MAG: GNAT family N-acetyltransferase, partial [Erysipelotrichaceae bacterium]
MDKLELKLIRYGDMEAMFDIFNDEKVSKYYMLPEFSNDEEKYRLFKFFVLLSADRNRFVKGIKLNRKLIGFINDVGSSNGSIELGIALDSKYHGKGIGTKAFSMAIAELFERGYKEVIAACFIENEASRRMMEKCGMTKTDIVEEIEYRGVVHEA